MQADGNDFQHCHSHRFLAFETFTKICINYQPDIAYRYEWEETASNSIRDDVRLTIERYRITETFLISVGIELYIAAEGFLLRW